MAKLSKIAPRQEFVTNGTQNLGQINIKAEGCETFGPNGEYLAKFPTMQAARAALYQLSIAGQSGQGGAK